MRVDPVFPKSLRDDDPLLKPTLTKNKAVVTLHSPIHVRGILAPGRYTRLELRESILQYFLKNGKKGKSRPEAWITGGGGGAGKTKILNHLGKKKDFEPLTKVLINADEIKELLPEYHEIAKAGDSRAAEVVHEESALLARELLVKALARKLPLIYDGTLSHFEKSRALIHDLKDAGYKICFVGVTIDPRIAIKRAIKRAFETGRYVPIKSLVAAHAGFNAHVLDYLDMMSENDLAFVFENSGEAPVEIFVDGAIAEEYLSYINEYSTFTEASL